MPEGIDVRGVGGYVIAPGAVMPDGRRYEPDAMFPRLSEKLGNGGLPKPPQWVVDLIRPKKEEAAPRSSDGGDERGYVEAALSHLNSDDRDTWLRVGGALHDSGHPWARQAWDSWSQTSSKFDRKDQEDTWASFRRRTGRKASIGSIIYEARANGFDRGKHEFSDAGRKAEASPKQASNWPTPKPLPNGLLPVLEFDERLLPDSIAPWVADISRRMQCPADFVGVSAVTAMGAALGRKIGIRPQERTDWTEVPNLWGMIVGRPGLMKSPAMSEALKPLHRLEALARDDHAAAFKAHQLALEVFKIEQAKARKAAMAKGGDAEEALSGLVEPVEPNARRYIVNDTSYEALGAIMVGNPNGVLAFRDELVSLLRTLDREEFAAARGFFLTAWNGTSSYTFDRIIRGHQHIDAACLSLLGSTQPGRIADYIKRATRGGAGDDGLIQRFGLLVWPDVSPQWVEVDEYPDVAARSAAYEAFDRLDRTTAEEVGAERGSFDTIPFLRLDDAASGLFREWHRELESRIRGGDLSPALESHLAKYRKLIPALSLLNHLADGGRGPISYGAVVKAVAFGEYLESHARRAYSAGSEVEIAAAKAILRRIRSGDVQDGFTLRDIHQSHWANLTDHEQAKAGLELLVDLDRLVTKTEQTGGRPRITYLINPRAKA